MTEVTAIFDVGKTNKKLLLFDEQGNVVDEDLHRFDLIVDDDGFPCEDINAISQWIKSEWEQLLNSKTYKVVAVNFTAFGASFVHIGNDQKPVAPMYDYLRPVETSLVKKFYKHIYQTIRLSTEEFNELTCSPKLGMLNSGFQLFWLKECKPELWKKIKCSLHLPQYLSYLITGRQVSDYTSLGCHTALWDFKHHKYSAWVTGEIAGKLAPVTSERYAIVKDVATKNAIKVGFGLHDSSSALIPYLYPSQNNFILISTGTWSIQLNPFNNTTLTEKQLRKDCLCYLQTDGGQVKASRLMLGREHDYQVSRIAKHFPSEPEFEKEMDFSEAVFWKVQTIKRNKFYPACMKGTGPFPRLQKKKWDISIFENAEEAYHSLIIHLVSMLKVSIQLVNVPKVKTFFVDGGFARNSIFMNSLAYSLYQKRVIASYLPQSTALGAFLHLHNLHGVKPNKFDSCFKIYSFSKKRKVQLT